MSPLDLFLDFPPSSLSPSFLSFLLLSSSSLLSQVDPNHATAHGVVGAIIAVLRPDLVAKCNGETVVFNGAEECEDRSRHISSLLMGKKMLVHGCGAVGSVVARELWAMGAEVMTIDAAPERAEIKGCKNISKDATGKEWWKLDVDAIVPCSASGELLLFVSSCSQVLLFCVSFFVFVGSVMTP